MRTRVLPGLFLFVLPCLARSDSWAPPQSGIYGCGPYGVKIILRPATALMRDQEKPVESFQTRMVCFELEDDGAEKVRWSEPLEYIPADVRVSDRGWVVGVNQYAHLGYAHSLVVWDTAGERIADYKLEDLMTSKEIAEHAMGSMSSRWWQADFEFQHDGYQGTYDQLLVTIRDRSYPRDKAWKKRLAVDLRTGKIWAGFDPDEFTDYTREQNAISECRARYGFVPPAKDRIEYSSAVPKEDELRIYARQNRQASEWELGVRPDGKAILTVKRGETRCFDVSREQLDAIRKQAEKSRFSELPAALDGDDRDPSIRSLVIETRGVRKAVTISAPDKLTDAEQKQAALRFLDCWELVRALFNDAAAVNWNDDVQSVRSK